MQCIFESELLESVGGRGTDQVSSEACIVPTVLAAPFAGYSYRLHSSYLVHTSHPPLSSLLLIIVPPKDSRPRRRSFLALEFSPPLATQKKLRQERHQGQRSSASFNYIRIVNIPSQAAADD